MEPAGLTLPVVLGHENAGRVAAVGDLVSTVAVGDPVLVCPPHTCGLCVACRRGRDMMCEQHEFTGLTDGRRLRRVPRRLRALDREAARRARPGRRGALLRRRASPPTTRSSAWRTSWCRAPRSSRSGSAASGTWASSCCASSARAARSSPSSPTRQRRALAAGLGADAVLDGAERRRRRARPQRRPRGGPGDGLRRQRRRPTRPAWRCWRAAAPTRSWASAGR